MKIMNIIVLVIVLIITLITIFNIYKSTDTYTDKICYEKVCIKYNQEYCNEWKPLGIEDCGFMCSNYYYLCDGVKVTRNCMEYGWIETNQSRISYGMKCEELKNQIGGKDDSSI